MANLAIVKTENGRVAKYAYFDSIGDAQAHCAKHGGFAVETDIPVTFIHVDADGKITRKPRTEGLAKAKEMAKARIDAEAERERSKHITMGFGKALAYLEIRDQALEVFAEIQSSQDGVETKARETWTAEDLIAMRAKYPMLVAELGFVGGSLKDMAQIVLDRYESFRQIEADLIVKVREAKSVIDQCECVTELNLVHL